MGEAETRFAELVWSREPIASGALVRLCGEELGWKSSTTYTVLRRLCDRGLLKNVDSTVTSLVSREEYRKRRSRRFVEDAFGGSLPGFLAAFIGGERLSREEAEQIQRLIDECREDGDE